MSSKTKNNTKIGSKISRLISVFSEFGAHSSFHCVPYIADHRRHLADRIWWATAIGFSALLCLNAINTAYVDWRENRVVVGFAHDPIPIRDITFPSLTICPMTKTIRSKFSYADAYNAMRKANDSRVLHDDKLSLMEVALEICDPFLSSEILNLFSGDYLDVSNVKRFLDLAPTIEDILVFCRFRDKTTNCSDLFDPIVTEDGLCYTFNALDAIDVASDEMAPDFFPSAKIHHIPDVESDHDLIERVLKESLPHRVYGAGFPSSLYLTLRISKPDIDFLCGGTAQGFKIKFHTPGQIPQVSKKSIQLSPDTLKIFSVSPQLTRANDNILKYSPDVRECYSLLERKLRFFQLYDQRNCEVECLANFTLAQCGCVKFSMPRTNDTKICGPAKFDCVSNAAGQIYQSSLFDKCNCLQSCDELIFDMDESYYPLDIITGLAKSKHKDKYDLEHSSYSRFLVSFNEEQIVPLIRSESHTFIDFLANSGGLFGLFMGASLLSFIELIYYLSVRLVAHTFRANETN